MTRTVEELESLIHAGRDEECIKFFAGMDETERMAFAKTAETAFKVARQQQFVQIGRTSSWNPALETSAIAVVATCSFSAMKGLGPLAIPYYKSLVAVLADRRPKWCDEYAEYLLDRDSYPWLTVRALMTAGLC
ncbi:MAG: hypothetical protein JSS02_09845, partial [Planctomycetes bacterium]|nr:hypothetical protein [Planctomycetota bacterium]